MHPFWRLTLASGILSTLIILRQDTPPTTPLALVIAAGFAVAAYRSRSAK